MKRVIKSATTLILLILLTSFTSKKDNNKKIKNCNYYSYVVYGKAMTNGKLKELEPVYKGFKIYKSTKKFFACFDSYRGTKSGKFNIINIGPYETEGVLYQEINRVREDLEAQGYKKAVKFKHTVTGAILYGNKSCR